MNNKIINLQEYKDKKFQQSIQQIVKEIDNEILDAIHYCEWPHIINEDFPRE